MTVSWRMDCVFAPFSRFDKHCRKENEGKGRQSEEHRGGHRANKGFFGCASNCRFYKIKEVKK